MCDYSLMSFPKRLATTGEELIVHRFSSGSLGFASPAELHRRPGNANCRSFWRALQDWLTPGQIQQVTAVCIPPSAKLVLHGLSARLRAEFGVKAEEEVTFQQLNAEAFTYRDALKFRNGRTIRLQHLSEGQRATVVDTATQSADNGQSLELAPIDLELMLSHTGTERV